MLWLLIVVYLGGDPISVRHAKIGQSFHSEQACIQQIQAIREEEPLPRGINLGCIPFKGKGV
tara:strand:- start:2254 stop:2439 length:186 start_codon:yes stop_codon:yes gene_type:complete